MATPHVLTGDTGHVPTINQISRVFEKPPAGNHGYADSSGRGNGPVICSVSPGHSELRLQDNHSRHVLCTTNERSGDSVRVRWRSSLFEVEWSAR